MEVKRAFRCYRGPDDPGPFSDIINSMSFGCRHMKEFNKNGVFCLTANTPEGYVKVLRVGDVDYIWTEGRMVDLIIAQSAKTPYIYYQDISSAIIKTLDPRENGNYTSWYADVSAASGGVANATSLEHGDSYGFDLMMHTYGPQSFLWNTERFALSGSLDFNIAFPYDFGWDFVNYVRTSYYSYGASYTFTRRTGATYKVIGVINYWYGRDPTWWPGVPYRSDLKVYEIEGESATALYTATLTTTLVFDPEDPTQVIGPEYFSVWGTCAMEDEVFYAQRYMRKINWTGPRQLILYKLDYEGNILAESEQINFPLNTDGISPPGWGDTFNADGDMGILRSNDEYVIHLSGFGQYIRVWDKDLNFIKNIEIPIGMHASTSSTRRKMCYAFGFIKKILYVNTFVYVDHGFEEPTDDHGYHTVYMYDIGANAGQEFLGTMRLYTDEVYDGGITVENYKR